MIKKVKSMISKGVSHDVDKNEMSLTKEAIAAIKKELKEENEKQIVYNQEKFGPVDNYTTILLIQVHKRLENLHYLVASLRAVKGIQDAMVVFSHDLWDPAINAFVRNITDFRVMQMFFPFSIQLYPLVFPGRDPKDCSWNTNTKGKNTDCQNAKWPDSYGHYREASFTQIKHHWWWKIHRVFEGLRVTRDNYMGHVVFLEEDHYVSPDILHVLSLMQRLRPALCPSCKVLALGNYNKLNPHVYRNLVEKGDWWVTKYNLGFAMDAVVWRSLSKCKEKFCTFDDYNWDWTMTNVAQTCLEQRLSMMSLRLSRVLHLGSCGTHVKKKVCDVQAEVKNAVSRLSASKQWLYPDILVPLGSWKKSGKPKKGNGGWGDLRDRELCRGIGNDTVDEAFLARLQAMTSV
ncbi:Alpha-1,6-mannosyl-glycoprotein 2-beta-N-acetylglucosaminyltransferase [Portunus trituberculatus]|uniref:Alpha-1,6-mannosyl-glycoprotein 2-beta-N-acetylglucosaminyltransferase n=1 Tax=Portunus trituberculatus TaxID=210409 RepID=A0A5B7CVY8_PORTR|nr:Alpha-1,6-mannosyl-glycoprotein 2-beta-N-acetylglucosaminyltransferase [Portunus trituberculatus]